MDGTQPPPLAKTKSDRSGDGSLGGVLRPSNRAAVAGMPVGISMEQIRELECAACNQLIQNPVYGPCGHSFCRHHLSEGATTDGKSDLDLTAEALRVCCAAGINEQRARETLVVIGSAEPEKVAEVCRSAAPLEGRVVKVHRDVTQPEFRWGFVTQDSIGRVAQIEGSHAYVDFPQQKRWHCLARELEVEPIGDEVKMGSTVRLRTNTNPSGGWTSMEGDETGTVVQISGAGVVVAAMGNMWCGPIGEVEVAPEPEDCKINEAIVPALVVKGAVKRLANAAPSDTCKAVLGHILTQACAKGPPFKIMLRGEKRKSVLRQTGAMDLLKIAGFRIVKGDNFKTRTLLESNNQHLIIRAKALHLELEREFGTLPAISDEEDMRYKVEITVEKSVARSAAKDFQELWTETLEGQLKPALAPPQSVWSWPRRGWETEEAFMANLAKELPNGKAVVARGQTKQHARQVISVLESVGLTAQTIEEGKITGDEPAVGEDPVEIIVSREWGGDIPLDSYVRLVDVPADSHLQKIGPEAVGVVKAQYRTSEADDFVYVVNFPRNRAQHVRRKMLTIDESSQKIKEGAQVKIRGSAQPEFGWQGVESSDLGVVHAVQFDGTVLVYYSCLDRFFLGTLAGLTTEDLPKVLKGNCPICREPLARGEHLGTDMAVQAQVQRLRNLMDGARVQRNDTLGTTEAAAPLEAPPTVARTTTQQSEMTCSICMDLLVAPVTLACGHSFCKAHIEAWLLQHNSCPNCKHRVVADRLYKRKVGNANQTAMFETEIRDTETHRGPELGEGFDLFKNQNEDREWPEIPVNQLLESQLVRHFPKELSDRRAEMAEEVWESLQRRSGDYLPRLRGFIRQFGDLAVEKLMEKGFSEIDSKLPGTRGGTLLMLAAEQGIASAVSQLLSNKADPLAVLNAQGEVGSTALSIAAGNGHLDALKTLLSSVEWPVVRVADALASAIEQQKEECAQVLLESDPLVKELSNSYGYPALVTAVQTNSVKMVDLLVKGGAKLDAPLKPGILVTGAGKVKLNGTYQVAGTYEGKKYYQNSNGAVLYCKNWWKIGHFTPPATAGGSSVAGWFYSMPEPHEESEKPPSGRWTTHGYDGNDANPAPMVQITSEEDQSAAAPPLLLAVQLGFAQVVERLLEAGGSPRMRVPDKGGELLQVACVGGDLKMVKLLLQNKASISAPDDQGYTPLHVACAAGHQSVVKELISQGASIEMEDSTLPSPLMLASCCGKYPPTGGRVWQASIAEKYEEVVEALVLQKADVNKTSKDGLPILYIAAMAGASRKAITLLLDNGADADASANGLIPFVAALRAGQSATARALIGSMKAVDRPLPLDFQQLTPLAAACLLGDTRLVDDLLSRLSSECPDDKGVRPWLNATPDNSTDKLVRVVATGFDTNFWQMVYEPHVKEPPSEGATAEVVWEVGDRAVLALDYEGKGYAARGPMRPGDVGHVVKKDKGSAPLQVKIRENLFWYRESALQKYGVITGEVKQYSGQFKHPYVENGRPIAFTVDMETATHGRWKLAEDVIPGFQTADVIMTREGKDVKIQQGGGATEFIGVVDEVGNLHGQVLHLNHKSGHFILIPAADNVTVFCPRHHAMERKDGLSSRQPSCDICGKDIAREEPIYFTCAACNYDVCSGCCGARLLARLPAEHPVHLNSWAPLHFAAAGGHREVVSQLLDVKAEVTVRDSVGRTPLHWACASGNSFMVELLLKHAPPESVADPDAHGFLPWKLVPGEMLRFSPEDRAEIHGNAVEVGRMVAPGEAGVAGLYILDGDHNKKPLYKKTDPPGWAIGWDDKTNRWCIYKEKYEADCIQYVNKAKSKKCPVNGWTSVAALDPPPSFEEAFPWRVGNMLIDKMPEKSRPRPYDLKSVAGGLPPLEVKKTTRRLALTIARAANGGITLLLPGGEPAPSELVQLLILEMIRRGDLPAEPPQGCVQQ